MISARENSCTSQGFSTTEIFGESTAAERLLRRREI